MAQPTKFLDIIERQGASKDVVAGAKNNLLLAGSQLIEGEPIIPIKPGEIVGGPDDSNYALPGAVLLIDEETVCLKTEETPEYDYHHQMNSEAEVSRSAITTFLSNRRFTTFEDGPNYAVYNNYLGYYRGPNGIYMRTVNLYAYFSSRRGDTKVIGLLQWRAEPYGPVVIAPGGLLRCAPVIKSGRVDETINKTHGQEVPHFARIREAHLCIRGTAEKAKARNKARRLSLSSNRVNART